MSLVPVARRKLFKARTQAGLTQRELADALGTSQTNVSRWELGIVSPSAYYKKKLCSYFCLSASDLGLDDLDQAPSPEQEGIDNAPLVDQRLIGRELELLRLRILLARRHDLVAVIGLPGVGKTALIAALVRDPHIRELFPDGVLWAPLGINPNKSIFSRWGKILGITEEEQAQLLTAEEWGIALRDAIGPRRMLIILDDVWKEETALTFKTGGPNCRHVVTTRFPSIASGLTNTVLTVGELDEEHSLLLLQALAPGCVECAPEQARKLIATVGGLPFALKLAGNYLRKEGRNLQPRRIAAAFERLCDAKERLQLTQAHSPDEPHSLPEEESSVSLHSLLTMSDKHLSPQARIGFYRLSVLPEKPATFSEEAALAVARCASEILYELNDAGLLEVSGERYTFHQVIADYARFHLQQQPEDVVSEAYRCLVEYTLTFALTYQEDIDKLEQEYSLYRVALEYADARGYYRQFIQLAAALATYIRLRLIYSMEFYLIRALEIAAAMESDEVYPPVIKILEERVRLRLRLGDRATAMSLAQFGMKRAQEAGDTKAHTLFVNLLSKEDEHLTNQSGSQ